MSVWDDLTREEQVRMGRKAEAILGDEAFLLATKEAERQLVAEWKAATSQAEREELWGRVNAIGEVASQLRKLQDSGAIAG